MSSHTDNNGLSPRIRSISTFVEEAAAQLRAREAGPFEDSEEKGDLLYLGNWQDPIPPTADPRPYTGRC
ncbi:MAG: hypothetical protein JMN27_15125 [gamma proteobacterium endosymbiont of Lamellibrachia anaximandri]|nr:hypothetical protein [gamma proteobacterium endosymbiont of Lamellibrachia anaximandri]MBL3535143.1 hypothetical protein [gamma proteobacterium endosymbiont of Lamellibrachia anaximandri]